MFQCGTAHVQNQQQQGGDIALVTATVVRMHGSNGLVSVYFRTMYVLKYIITFVMFFLIRALIT